MRYVVLTVMLVAFLGAPALADTVHLKNGRKMVGKVTVKGDQVIVETALGTMSFSRRQVERIEKDDKTLRVPKATKPLPRTGTQDRPWRAVPDMPSHHVPYADITAGSKLVAYSPRNGLAIFGIVDRVKTEGEQRTFAFEPPSKTRFTGKDSQFFAFYKVDTETTQAKLMFFGCVEGDELLLRTNDGKKRNVVFRVISGKSVVIREGIKAPETLEVNTIYMVINRSSKKRSLESYLKSKDLKEGDGFQFADSDGTVRMGKLVKGESGLEVQAAGPDVKLDWAFVEKMTKLTPEGYEARMKRLKTSKAAYDLAVKPGDKIDAAITAYGKPDQEGDGITGRIGIKGAQMLGLYARFFSKTGLWVSSRKNVIYELETDKGFAGNIFGLSVGLKLTEAAKLTDLNFYRANMNNPRILISDTLYPVRVAILLNPRMTEIDKIRVFDPQIAGDWVVNAGMVMRQRLAKTPNR